MVKLMVTVRNQFSIHAIVWVTGSENGFPTSYGRLLLCSTNEVVVSACKNETTNLILVSLRKCAGNKVVESLDEALLLTGHDVVSRWDLIRTVKTNTTSDNEHEIALMFQSRLVLDQSDDRSDAIETLLSRFVREEDNKGECVWIQGLASDRIKLLCAVSLLENEAETVKAISQGNTIGELGLLHGLPRMSSVYCESSKAIA